MDIRSCIADLLAMHDCVIIPGLGGFIGNYSPARIDPVHHSFQPPCKKILFNVNLKQNDGLLANAVANSYGTAYADACNLLERFAAECRQALRSGQSFDIPGVGRLVQGKEGNIQFEQDKNANLLPGAYGLVTFISPPVSRSHSILGLESPFIASSVHRPATRVLVPRILRWAAILALPVGLALVVGLTRYGRFAGGSANDASMLGSVISKFSSASLVEKQEAPRRTLTVLPKQAPVAPAAPEVKPEAAVSAISPEDPYAIIVGAFRMKENAEKLIASLHARGVEATVYDRSRTGLYRVTIGTCEKREAARELLALAKSSDFRDAWLLAK